MEYKQFKGTMAYEAYDSLQDMVEDTDDLAQVFRDQDLDHSIWEHPDLPDVFTNWVEEQRAMRETCVIADQSYHMQPVFIEGPEAIDFYDYMSPSNVDKFREQEPPTAKHLMFTDHRGHSIRDLICFNLEGDRFVTLGSPTANNWVHFNAETLDYDITAEKPYTPITKNIDPPEFRFEVQGPTAMDIMDDVTDGEMPRISFFEMDKISINGHELFALGHGMAGTPGIEVFGDFELHDEIKGAILEAGQEHGLLELGSSVYKTGAIESGWLPFPVPAIYDSEEMREYREWLDADMVEGRMSIGGSYKPDNIEDYYLDPFQRNLGRLIDWDGDFIGKEGLKEKQENQTREIVTYVWDDDDFIDIFASLVREGETYKVLDLPDPMRRWSKAHYDRVEIDGEIVGLSNWPGYLYPNREMLAVGVIDKAYAEPGTKATLIWGEEGSNKQKVERHVEKEVEVTVAPVPYADVGRRDL